MFKGIFSFKLKSFLILIFTTLLSSYILGAFAFAEDVRKTASYLIGYCENLGGRASETPVSDSRGWNCVKIECKKDGRNVEAFYDVNAGVTVGCEDPEARARKVREDLENEARQAERDREAGRRARESGVDIDSIGRSGGGGGSASISGGGGGTWRNGDERNGGAEIYVDGRWWPEDCVYDDAWFGQDWKVESHCLSASRLGGGSGSSSVSVRNSGGGGGSRRRYETDNYSERCTFEYDEDECLGERGRIVRRRREYTADCVDCSVRNRRSGAYGVLSGLAEFTGALAPPLFHYLGVRYSADSQLSAQQTWANAYRSYSQDYAQTIRNCQDNRHQYFKEMYATMQSQGLPFQQMRAPYECNRLPGYQFPGGIPMAPSGFGPGGNPFAAAGYSPGFTAGIFGPFGQYNPYGAVNGMPGGAYPGMPGGAYPGMPGGAYPGMPGGAYPGMAGGAYPGMAGSYYNNPGWAHNNGMVPWGSPSGSYWNMNGGWGGASQWPGGGMGPSGYAAAQQSYMNSMYSANQDAYLQQMALGQQAGYANQNLYSNGYNNTYFGNSNGGVYGNNFQGSPIGISGNFGFGGQAGYSPYNMGVAFQAGINPGF